MQEGCDGRAGENARRTHFVWARVSAATHTQHEQRSDVFQYGVFAQRSQETRVAVDQLMKMQGPEAGRDLTLYFS